MEKRRVTGETLHNGFEIGVRRTLPIGVEELWTCIISPEGLKIWLGEMEDYTLYPGKRYQTMAGTEGLIKILKPLSHIRLTRKESGQTKHSTLQIRCIRAKTGTALSFHQENLANAISRQEMKEYWEDKIRLIASYLKK